MRPRSRRMRGLNAPAEWQRQRDFQIGRCVAGGLGIRPRDWWLYESGRPELAPLPDEPDAHAHMDPWRPATRHAAERLLFLAQHDLLEPSERRAIAAGTERAHEWRRSLLGITPRELNTRTPDHAP